MHLRFSRWIVCCLSIFIWHGSTASAYGDVGLVLDESLNTGLARIVSTGHSAIYLSRLCPDSPIKLRLCTRDEHGSVLSAYRHLGEDTSFQWNVVPFETYLYGTDDFEARPVFGSKKIKEVLETRYRERHLSEYCTTASCISNPKADWREMVAATMSRGIFVFVVQTTLQQDLELMAEMNSAPNENHFNYFIRNCANFAQLVIKSYFPHAVHVNRVNDFGVLSPKALARSFSRFAILNSALKFQVLHFAQLPGTIPRSSDAREATEELWGPRKLLFPTILFANHELPLLGAAYITYLLSGRFNAEKLLEQYTCADNAGYMGMQVELGCDRARENVSTRGAQERVPDLDEWSTYRTEFGVVLDQAVRSGAVTHRTHLNSVLWQISAGGQPYVDAAGRLWMSLSVDGSAKKLGLSACNILDESSDTSLAYRLLLARNNFILNSPRGKREDLADFEHDWTLMQEARNENELQAYGLR